MDSKLFEMPDGVGKTINIFQNHFVLLLVGH